MFDLRKTTAIISAKAIAFILRKTKSGGTAAPGLTALKIDPNLIIKLRKHLKYSIIISGTNGKTTTARMLASILKSSNIQYFHNRTGSNLLRGVASELIKHSGIASFPKNRVGLWEIDEAVFPDAVEQLNPKIIVLTNLFRDQLDRYGEIDTLVKKWKKVLKKLSNKTTVILNADDPTIASIGKKLTHLWARQARLSTRQACKIVYFGIKCQSLGSQVLSHASDATICPNCFLPLTYKACFVSHLGIYECPKCKQIQPKTDITCINSKFLKDQSCLISIKSGIKNYFVSINLPGIYNIYNVLASFSIALNLKINNEKIINGFKNFKPAFGRFEVIKINKKILKILLVKNPAGFNEVLKILVQLTSSKDRAKGQKASCLIALNDLIADGRDVSWIWDVDFKLLKKVNIEKLVVSGTRTYDMALRLKHANFQENRDFAVSHHSEAPIRRQDRPIIDSQRGSYRPSDFRMTGGKYCLQDDKDGELIQESKNGELIIEKDLKRAINLLLKSKSGQLFILPTYTAMLEIRKILAKKGLVHSTWSD